MSIKDRKKANDIFTETEYPFGKKVSFKEAFPEIDDLIIDIKEIGCLGSLRGLEVSKHYSMDNLPREYVNCSNPLCYDGGFSIGKILRNMVQSKEIEKEGSEICHGYEGSPKGKRNYRSCVNNFHYLIKLQYNK